MRQWIEDLGLKLAALGLAVLLWAYVGAGHVMERRMDLRVAYLHLPAGAVLTGDVRTTLRVVLVGRKDRVLPLDGSDLKVEVSLKGLPVPAADFPVRASVPGLPKGVAAEVPSVLVSLAPTEGKPGKGTSKPR
jgi:hypothetical protein